MGTRNKVMSNIIWRFAERAGAQFVSFVVTIILARILLPSDYGTVALITVIITVLNVFVDSGMGNALIQKKDATDKDFSTVFWFNLIWCVFIYLILFFSAPFIAKFYNNKLLISLTRVIGFTIVVSGVKNVQQAYVSKTMQFKKFFFATLVGTIISAVVGILMAYNGFGPWALVAQHLTNTIIDTMILYFMVKWKPSLYFSFNRWKSLFSFGWKLLLSSLIETVYNNIRQLVIGKLYTSSDLAFYNKGKTFPYVFITCVNNAVDSVLLPTMSKEQDDKERIKIMTRKAMKTSTYLMAPLMMGLAAISTPLVRLLMTEKWLPCVPFLIISCVTYMFRPIQSANLNAIKALGRSDIILVLDIIKKAIGLVLLLISIKIGVLAMAITLMLASFVDQIVNSWPNKKLLNYGYIQQLKDILPGIVIAVVMAVAIFPIQWLGLSDLFTVVLQILSGAIIYIVLSKLFRIDSFEYILSSIRLMLKKTR